MKAKRSVYGKELDRRWEYELGGNRVCIDKLTEPLKGHSAHYIWTIRESKKHAKKRSDELGEIVFPHVHISVIKISEAFGSHGDALNSAIQYLNKKRKSGEL